MILVREIRRNVLVQEYEGREEAAKSDAPWLWSGLKLTASDGCHWQQFGRSLY